MRTELGQQSEMGVDRGLSSEIQLSTTAFGHRPSFSAICSLVAASLFGGAGCDSKPDSAQPLEPKAVTALSQVNLDMDDFTGPLLNVPGDPPITLKIPELDFRSSEPFKLILLQLDNFRNEASRLEWPGQAQSESIQTEISAATRALAALQPAANQPNEQTAAENVLRSLTEIVNKQNEMLAKNEEVRKKLETGYQEILVNFESVKNEHAEQREIIAELNGKLEVIQKDIEFARTQMSILTSQNQELSKVVESLNAALKELRSWTNLEVIIAFVDVYGDGSSGSDCWSIHTKINDQTHHIWIRQNDIGDDCTGGNGPGPSGDEDCCRYSPLKSIPIRIRNDAKLTVEFGGTAHDNNIPLQNSTLSFTAADNWGANGNGHLAEGMKLNKMGGVNAGTEYNVYFCVRPN